MDYRLKITQADFETLQQLVLADLPRESGAFALAGISTRSDGVDILVRRPLAVPKDLFTVQHEYRLEVAAQAINGLIALCERNKLGALICHSHPSDIPYSPSDDHGERRIVDTLRRFIPSNAPTASLLFYPGGVRGRVWLPRSARPLPLTEICIIGRAFRRLRFTKSPRLQPIDSLIFDRQVLAFGEEGQRLIHAAKVGIVGVGGTGSPTAEQFVRLGVRDLLLIDPDQFSPSNLTRVYGTFASDLPKPRSRAKRPPALKVDLIARHLRRISPEATIRALPQNIVFREAAKALLDRDIIFLCTDNQWSRAVVNQITYQYFIPTINLGARIDTDRGAIRGAVGIVDVLRPDLPCLWCRQSLQAGRVATESLPPEQRTALHREGYVEGIDTPAPSVISLTTTVSGLAVTLGLQLLTDFMGDDGAVARLNHDLLTATVSRGTSTILPKCICTTVRGYGDLKTLNVLSEAHR